MFLSQEAPYVMEKADGGFEGFCIDILNEVAERMNFKYEIYQAPDKQYGNELANGSWSGVIRELIEKVSWHFFEPNRKTRNSF